MNVTYFGLFGAPGVDRIPSAHELEQDLAVFWTKGKGLSAKSLTWKKLKARIEDLG